VLAGGGLRVAVMGVTDHPPDFAAGPDRPGVAFADLADQTPDWLLAAVRAARAPADAVLVTPHWGQNVTTEPVGHVRRAADALVDAGATLVAGHSVHVPHGSPARSCTTWVTTASTHGCATTSACCFSSSWMLAARSGWRRSR
jgi:poly-gamma-glutamate synthesis protein (capsule biosynthesis protein)